MKKISLITFLLAGAGLLVTSFPSPVLAEDDLGPLKFNWGRSYESAKYRQILNPKPAGTKPVENLDGQASTKVMEEYRGSFGKETGVKESILGSAGQ